MFDFLFGWRKASDCKKLIKRVQCRIKLLKNKRCSMVRQLRDDVGQLLKHGHEQSAFDRVEQLFKDESIVAVYDLLDHFCEFIILHISYIRKHRDCPNDINEAVSTLIFASARCGDLPELPVIRKLFGERYGQRFALVALELLPGNLVNRQIKENLSIKSIPIDAKYRLVDEIARSCLQPGPLALEYYSELQLQQINENKGGEVVRSDVQTNCSRNEESLVQEFNIMEGEGKIVHVDFASGSRKIMVEPCQSHQGSDSTGGSMTPKLLEWSTHRNEEGRVGNNTHLNSPYEYKILAPTDQKDVGMAVESSSESSGQFPKELIYLDDIEEKSPMSKDGKSCQDQRLFMFKSSVMPTIKKLEDGYDESCGEKSESWNEKSGSRKSRKSRKASGKRQRMRSVSREGRSLKDVESTIYYGQHGSRTSHYPRKHQKKISFDETRKSLCAHARLDQQCRANTGKSEIVHDCSLEDPCYFCTSDEKDDWGMQKRRNTTLERFPVHNLKEEKVEHDICCHYCRCFCTGEQRDREVVWELLPQKQRRDYQIGVMMGGNLTYPEHVPNEPVKKVGKANGYNHPPYLRAMTMIPERPPSDCRSDNVLRSNSFPIKSSTSRHVHPKLPDYDQLEAQFMALKKANLQCKSNQLAL